MDKLLTLMNFSHVYENEKFYLSEEYNQKIANFLTK